MVVVATATTRFQPVFGALLAMAIGLEQFRTLKLVSVLMAVGGALLMSASNFSSTSKLTGLIALLCGALSMSLFYILQKPVVKK